MHHLASVDERGSDAEQLDEEVAAVSGPVMQCDVADDGDGQLLLLLSQPESHRHSVVS